MNVLAAVEVACRRWWARQPLRVHFTVRLLVIVVCVVAVGLLEGATGGGPR